jgi:transposase
MHNEEDIQTFRMITSQFIVTGLAKHREIAETFGISLTTVKRGVKLYRQKGVKGFYEKRKRGGASVLTEGVLKRAQELLDEDMSLMEIGREIEVKTNTLNKAVQAGKLHRNVKKKESGN